MTQAGPGLQRRRLAGGLCGWAVLPGLGALGGCSPTPARIGFLGGLTGTTSDLGVAGRDSTQMAVESFNRQGGLKGREVELIGFDDRQQPASLEGLLPAIREARLLGMVGPMTSSVASQWIPLAQVQGMVTVSPTVTSSDFSGVDDLFFRVCSSTREYASVSARFCARQAGWSSIAVVRDEGNAPYTRSWVSHFQTTFQALSRVVPPVVAYTSRPEGTPFDEILERALRLRPQVLVFVCAARDMAVFAQLLRKGGARLPLVAAEWAATDQLLRFGGQAVEGVTVAQYVNPDSDSPPYQAFADAFQRRHARRPGFAEVSAHDATTVLLTALHAQRPDEPLAQTLLRLRRFQGLQQEVVFDEHGDAQRQLYLTRVAEGRFAALS